MSKRRRRVRLAVAGVLLAATVGVAAWWFWPEPDVGTGAELFHTHPLGEPSTTGLPYALVLACMQRYPEILGRDAGEFCARFGALPDPDSPEGLPVGFALRPDRRSGTDYLVTTCALCHTGEVGGQRIVGLSNRNLRTNALYQAVLQIAGDPAFVAEDLLPVAEAAAQRHGLSWGWRARLATNSAIQALRQLAREDADRPWGKLGEIDAGPGRHTPVEFAKATAGVWLGPPYGFVKLPAVWTYQHRKSFGCDAAVVGDGALVLSVVEFVRGSAPGDVLHHPGRWQRLEEYLWTIRPPAFPGPIDRPRTRRGEALFVKHCASCHGRYIPGRPPDYTERVVDLEMLGTDPQRLRSVTELLSTAPRVRALAPHVRLIPARGYVAPPLTGLWCRAPYLHNGSVPTLADLLRPAEQRAASFHVGGDTGYDLERVGLAYEEETIEGRRHGKRASPGQYRFDTAEPGNDNGGHRFGTELPEADRADLLEYLKTL